MTWKQYVLGAACAVALTQGDLAYAQRADENAVTSAEDAFGTRVGNEGVGLYDMRSARGFDPQQAGNMRVEGLYIDIQGMFGMRLTKSSTIRIGLSAQSYPFPAPTGIVDFAIQLPADRTVISPQVTLNAPIGMNSVVVDVSTPLIGDKLGMVGGFNAFKSTNEAGTKSKMLTTAALFRFRPSDNIEIIPFIFDNRAFNNQIAPSVFLAGAALPLKYDRDLFYGQEWATRKLREQNLGLIVRSALGVNWRLQTGLFHTEQSRARNHVVFFRNTQVDGSANLDILRYPRHYHGSYSGEIRASRVFTDGKFRHTVHFGVRGRDVVHRFGGGQTLSFGLARVAVYRAIAEPTYTFGVRDEDLVKQVMPGATYVGQWAGVGELSFGLQKSFYHRDFGKEGGARATTKSQPWLYNGTLALYATADLAFYAGYTRGLEEFGTAPDNVVNAGEPLPAKVTKQIDGGLRYRIIPGVNFVAGVFEVSKPYFDRSPANIFTDAGSLRHRGIEISLAGKVVPHVTVVAGAVLLQARVSGPSVDQRLIGRIPPGTPPTLYRASVQYDFASVRGLSVDVTGEINGSHYANRLNTLRVPSTAQFGLGSRYSFNVGATRATLRAQVQNITNSYDWQVDGASGRIYPTQPRRYTLRLSADF